MNAILSSSPPPPRIIGHRGASLKAPENTLAGLRHAHALGARWVEFDVQATRDDCPILLHDARLERTTDGRGIAAERSAADIATLDAGRWFAAQYRGERVPRLDEALALLDALAMGAVIEVKAAPGDGPRTMRATLAALSRCGTAGGIVLSSFAADALAVAQAAAPGIPRALIVKSVPADWRVRTERLQCAALHADHRALDAAIVAAVSAHLPLRAYTVNAPERARTLFAWGAAAVFTDCPDVLISGVRHQTAGPAAAGLKGSREK
ncbi:MAG TPA: glycerophosphodiester phosphodiesterase family protein [Stellaceae bacterium]|nr:glycerophosphodiester phosphodiesterase family protein [Stellaceae bacterium]